MHKRVRRGMIRIDCECRQIPHRSGGVIRRRLGEPSFAGLGSRSMRYDSV